MANNIDTEYLQQNLMSASQVADVLGITKNLASRLLKNGDIQSIQFAGQAFVVRSELANWIDGLSKRLAQYNATQPAHQNGAADLPADAELVADAAPETEDAGEAEAEPETEDAETVTRRGRR